MLQGKRTTTANTCSERKKKIAKNVSNSKNILRHFSKGTFEGKILNTKNNTTRVIYLHKVGVEEKGLVRLTKLRKYRPLIYMHKKANFNTSKAKNKNK